MHSCICRISLSSPVLHIKITPYDHPRSLPGQNVERSGSLWNVVEPTTARSKITTFPSFLTLHVLHSYHAPFVTLNKETQVTTQFYKSCDLCTNNEVVTTQECYSVSSRKSDTIYQVKKTFIHYVTRNVI